MEDPIILIYWNSLMIEKIDYILNNTQWTLDDLEDLLNLKSKIINIIKDLKKEETK